MFVEVHQREGPSRGAWQVGFEVEAEGVEDGGDDFARVGGAFGGDAADMLASLSGCHPGERGVPISRIQCDWRLIRRMARKTASTTTGAAIATISPFENGSTSCSPSET